MSTPCSPAILRTTGDDLVRRSSSFEAAPPSCGGLGGAGAAAVGEGAAGGGGGAATGAGGASGFDCLGSSFGAAGASDAGWAAGGFAPAPLITATTVLTGTVSPSCTFISERTPEVGAGISASTLSVEISNSGSSRFTESPTVLG